MALNRLKKILLTGSFALASALGAIAPADKSSQTEKVTAVQKSQRAVFPKIINKAGDSIFEKIFQDQLQIMAQTKIGSAVLKNLPEGVSYIIAPTPEYSEEAGFWDGQNCTIYDDTLLSAGGGCPVLIAHETRHSIQGYNYAKDYLHIPTEQQIAYAKMTEIETRLQDVLMKEELYNQNSPGSRSYEFSTADWRDYRKIKTGIAKANPTLPANQVERMARTQFVIDSWQGNYQKKEYDQRAGVRTLKDWLRTYNENSLRLANKRSWAIRPMPDTTVDENLIQRHHKIMQEFIQRMKIDVPSDFFDDLKNDKSLKVIHNPKELEIIGKHFGKKLKMVIVPRDDFVRVGGIVVAKDNSTLMFNPEQRKTFEKEIQGMTLANRTKQVIR